MMWVLVILTVHGGTSSTQSSLAQCSESLRHIRTSGVRQAYCLSATGDQVYFIKDGKQLVEVE